MKTITLISFLFLLLLFNNSKAQTYHPLPTQNAYWINWGGVALLSCPDCIFIKYMYYTDGDTLINNTSYVKINKIENPAINNISLYPTYTGAIRQDTIAQKVYVVLSDSAAENILYDFSLKVGDTVKSILHDLASDCFGFNIETITSIDSIFVNGNYRRRFNIEGSCGSTSYIEGIGSIYGLLFPYRKDDKESHLGCLIVHGQTYYPNNTSACSLITSVNYINNEEIINIYLDPVNSMLNIAFKQVNRKTTLITIYNCLGQEIKKQRINSQQAQIDISELPIGIYLVLVITNNKTICKKIFKAEFN